MLNLRQLGHLDEDENSTVLHLSHLSVNFLVPSNILGNIGEPLAHDQFYGSFLEAEVDNVHAGESSHGAVVATFNQKNASDNAGKAPHGAVSSSRHYLQDTGDDSSPHGL